MEAKTLQIVRQATKTQDQIKLLQPYYQIRTLPRRADSMLMATVDNFFVDSMIQPIDDNDYER